MHLAVDGTGLAIRTVLTSSWSVRLRNNEAETSDGE